VQGAPGGRGPEEEDDESIYGGWNELDERLKDEDWVTPSQRMQGKLPSWVQIFP
jgi:hypothetical protein